MRMSSPFFLLLLSAQFATACSPNGDGVRSELLATAVPVGQLKGYKAVSDQVKERLFEAGSTSQPQLTSYFNSGSGLSEYMGSFSAVTGEYNNGHGNSVNAMLWDLALTNVAHDLTQSCDSDDATVEANPQIQVAGTLVTLRADVRESVRKLCSDGADVAALDLLYANVMSFDAPDSERDEWVTFANSSAPADGAGAGDALAARKVWLRGTVRALLLNPYFLINN